MAVRLRLMRMGKKKQPTYRVVAADSRSPRNGRFIEIIGTYQPRLDPSVIKIDNERAVHWLQNGAQPSETVQKLLKISGAWADYKGEQFVPPVPPAPRTKSSLKKPEPSAPASESNESNEAESEGAEIEEISQDDIEQTSQDDEVAVVEDNESTDEEADSVSDGDDEEQS
ncbi:MAG: 30S ribosomal protein S16 [Acidimicrobiales bacterium MED-G01]|nr:MAG: 30S ribosomal protein S16 [Acidimicrobiales bacterium MED-G01]